MLTNLPEKQELQEEEIPKACRKLPKKEEKRLSSPIKQLSKNDLDNSNKSENLFLHDESYSRRHNLNVFTLDDILTKLCSQKFFSIL